MSTPGSFSINASRTAYGREKLRGAVVSGLRQPPIGGESKISIDDGPIFHTIKLHLNHTGTGVKATALPTLPKTKNDYAPISAKPLRYS